MASVFIGALLIKSPLLALAAVAAPGLAVFAFAFPAAGVALWLAFTVAVPEWTSVSVAGLSLSPYQFVAVPVLVGVFFSRKRGSPTWSWVDLALIVGTGGVVALTFFGGSPAFLLVNLIAVLMLGYTMGRFSPRSIYKPFAVVMIGVALWGILEFVSGIHIFTGWQLSVTQHWNEIQTRGGLDRSEAGMGHAIAFGAACAMAIPFAQTFKKYAVPAQIILVAGALTSLSRGPMLTLVLTLGLSAVILTSGRKRFSAVSLLVGGMLIVYLIFGFIYSGSDAGQVQASSDVRAYQLSSTLDSIGAIGAASNSAVLNGERVITSTVEVIDSTPLRLMVNFGWVIALLLLSPWIYAMLSGLRRRTGPASIALIGQIPVMLVTSLITQWQVLLFLVAGLAVSELDRARKHPSHSERERSTPENGHSEGEVASGTSR